MVDIYTLTINTSGSNTEKQKEFCIESLEFLNSIISGSYVQNKTVNYISNKTQVFPNFSDGLTQGLIPSWAANIYSFGTNSQYSLCGSIDFEYAGTKFCLTFYTYTIAPNYFSRIKIYMKNLQISYHTDLTTYSTNNDNANLSDGETLSFLIAQSANYFIVKKIYNIAATAGSHHYHAVLRIDSPTNSADTNAYVTIAGSSTGNNRYYNSAFNNEDIINTIVSITSDSGTVEEDTSFARNYYNNKIPLSSAYAFTPVQGVRGKMAYLLFAPANYVLEPIFYNINGEEYVGLEDFSGNFANNGKKNILLKCL